MIKRKPSLILILFTIFVIVGLIVNFAVDWSEWVKRLTLSLLLFVLVLIYYLTSRDADANDRADNQQ